MNRGDVIRLAKDAGLGDHQDFRGDSPVFSKYLAKLEGFATLVIADFLKQSGRYVTNDASRQAVIRDAVEIEREACARICDESIPPVERFDTQHAAGDVARHCGDTIRA